ncbi:anti-sigma-K factor RskA [Agromyces terreus]|uniref:Regulator of SigK n=1 Tax=Agromyces terreus TaxID=424795 RepID=A0A9X2H056_9MICO|nr:anti-sigma factor [Agromyces terreus]MCP2370726.1 anti-sigma-K factor RskA [Agromyces terreus]
MNRPQGPTGDELRELFDLAPAYALDALDEFERARFERALAASPELQAEVDSFRAIASGFGEAVEPVAPPASLKAGLFDRLDAAPQERPAESERADASKPASPAPVADLGERRSRRRLAVVLSSAAAAVVLLAVVVVGANWFGPNGWGAQREMTALAAASDAQQITAPVTGGGEVTLVTSVEQGRSAILADGLDELGDEHTYELWYIDEAGAVSAGTFDVANDGETWRILEGEFAPGTAVGITVEPAGGSDQPTTDPVAVIQT